MASTLLFQRLKSVARDLDNVKVGLEATSHYSYNILGFLLGKGLSTFVLNPLHTNLYRKSTSLRRTKTDCVDARTIAAMMMSDVILKSYTAISYHNEELKSLSRYRFDKVRQRAKLKQSISRLVTILFPELKKTRSFAPHSVGLCSATELPGAKQVASAISRTSPTSSSPLPKATMTVPKSLNFATPLGAPLAPACPPNLLNFSILGLPLNAKTTMYPLKQGVRMLNWRFVLTDTGKIIKNMNGKKLGK